MAIPNSHLSLHFALIWQTHHQFPMKFPCRFNSYFQATETWEFNLTSTSSMMSEFDGQVENWPRYTVVYRYVGEQPSSVIRNYFLFQAISGSRAGESLLQRRTTCRSFTHRNSGFLPNLSNMLPPVRSMLLLLLFFVSSGELVSGYPSRRAQ